MGIYSYELYSFYNVETILRISSCGGYVKNLHAMDIVLAYSSYSQSTYALMQSGDEKMIQFPDFELNKTILNISKKLNISTHPVQFHCTDAFYHKDFQDQKEAMELGCQVVEMESFALFHNAHFSTKKRLVYAVFLIPVFTMKLWMPKLEKLILIQ